MKTWTSDTLFSRDTNLWHLSCQGKVMLNFPFFSSNHLVNCPSQAIQSTWRFCHIAWKICHLKGSGLLILTEGRERELEDLVASQWNLPDPPLRPYSILLTPPFIDSQFSTVSNLYSVSNDWYPPSVPYEKHVIPPKILPPCAWDKWWLIPNSLCSETVMSVFRKGLVTCVKHDKICHESWYVCIAGIFLFLLIHVYFTFSFY